MVTIAQQGIYLESISAVYVIKAMMYSNSVLAGNRMLVVSICIMEVNKALIWLWL